MTMFEVLQLGSALLAGLALGAMFFGGLLWTVHKMLAADRPALWLFASMLLRVAAALAGFYAVGGQEWRRWGACLAGFVLARIIVARVAALRNAPAPATEVSHASES